MHTGRLHLHNVAVPLFLTTNRPNTNCGLGIVIQKWHNGKWTDKAGRQTCLATFTRQQLVEVVLQDEGKKKKNALNIYMTNNSVLKHTAIYLHKDVFV